MFFCVRGNAIFELLKGKKWPQSEQDCKQTDLQLKKKKTD